MTPKVVLFDADSLIYQAMYRVVSISEIREMMRKGDSRFSIELEILQRGYDRFEKIAFDILNDIEANTKRQWLSIFLLSVSVIFGRMLIQRTKPIANPIDG